MISTWSQKHDSLFALCPCLCLISFSMWQMCFHSSVSSFCGRCSETINSFLLFHDLWEFPGVSGSVFDVRVWLLFCFGVLVADIVVRFFLLARHLQAESGLLVLKQNCFVYTRTWWGGKKIKRTQHHLVPTFIRNFLLHCQINKNGTYQNNWATQEGIWVHEPSPKVWWPDLTGRRKSGWAEL